MNLVNRYFVAQSDIELFAAAISQAQVLIAYKDMDADWEKMIQAGTIEQYTPNFVRIAGTYYARDQYEFRIRFTI